MNRKYFLCIPFMAFLLITSQSFSMHKVIFTASRIVSVGFLPFCAANNFYKPPVSESVPTKPVPVRIQAWGTDILEKLNVPEATDIVWVDGEDWATEKDKSKCKIRVPMTSSFEGDVNGYMLDYALDQKRIQGLSSYEWVKETILGRPDSGPLSSFADQENDKIIARNSIILKHEVGHIVNKDDKNRMEANIIYPLIVQLAASTSTYCFNKLLNIKPPKTVVQSLGRSVLAVGGIIPKLFFTFEGLSMYSRYTEKRADEYACRNAETRLELTEFADYFKEYHAAFVSKLNGSIKKDEKMIREVYSKFDPGHPYLLDRVAMIEKYIQKWDEEHKHENNNE